MLDLGNPSTGNQQIKTVQTQQAITNLRSKKSLFSAGCGVTPQLLQASAHPSIEKTIRPRRSSQHEPPADSAASILRAVLEDLGIIGSTAIFGRERGTKGRKREPWVTGRS
jgi:hypothetical protein